MNKTILSIISVIVSLLYLPIIIYSNWLLLEKVNGTDIMYFLFWLSIPFAIVTTLLSKLVSDLSD